MNRRRYQTLSRVSLCLLIGLMSLSLGATWKDEPRLQSLTGVAPAIGAVDAPGHHFGFSQRSVLAQATPTQTQIAAAQTQTVVAAIATMRAAPTPGLTGGAPCTTTVGNSCQITGGVTGTWVKTASTTTSPAPNRFTFSAAVPDGAAMPQSGPPIFIPTTAGSEVHNCTQPSSVGSNVSCTGTTTSDIVASRTFVVRFQGSAGPIDVTNGGVQGYTGGGACPGRPTVNVSTTPDGHGRLAVNVQANPGGGVDQNVVYALDFGAPRASTNAVIDVGTRVGLNGVFSVSLAPAQPQITFYARPAFAGEAVTVNFTAVDACGAWASIAGGGPETTRLSAATPAADVVAASANLAVVGSTLGTSAAPASALPSSLAPNLPALNSAPAAPINAPVAAVAAPAAPAPLSAPGAIAPAPAAGSQAATSPFGAPSRVVAPFTRPQPLLPFMPAMSGPAALPVAPWLPPTGNVAPAPVPNPAMLPNSGLPFEALPALAPPVTVPERVVPPAAASAETVIQSPFATDGAIVPPLDAMPVLPEAAPDEAAVAEDPQSIEPPFAQ